MNKKLAYLIATFFGVGYCPKASGTAGSLATLPFAFLLAFYGGFPAMLAALALIYILGTLATKEVLKHSASSDPSIVVIDEVAGQLVPLAYISAFVSPAPNEWWLFIALPSFILFRIFDIAKPFPASYFDKKIKNAHGVMLDDIAAGIYVILVLQILYFLAIDPKIAEIVLSIF